MKELKILKFQAEVIQDALRLVININNCASKKTSFDRDVMAAKEYIDNVLDERFDREVSRF